MEITEEQLITIRNRVEEVFIAKTGFPPEEIKLDKHGEFWCSYSWNIPYGGTDYHYECINANDLGEDLDEHIRIRKLRDEEERIKREQKQQAERMKYEEARKSERKKQYDELRKEFEK